MRKALNELFDKRIEHQRIKKFGNCQRIAVGLP